MADFHGEIGNGQFGIMSVEQVRDMVIRKASLRPTPEWKSNCTTAINKIISDPTAQPCDDYKYNALTVYHASSGVGPTKGCTLFYVVRPGEVLKIIGCGYHVGQQTYDIDWKESGWCNANRISLD